ncbi:gliding motility-associated C-terminal domain-containing protein, partial [Marivirga sp.]|uniref:T9SS type B sorting domain-containing protein n=1 Tax=Marivirga sp. TaxID=2018662 RepID=UPI002D7F677C
TNTGAGTGSGDVLDGPTGIVDYTAATAGTYVYEYEIAATATCPGATSTVTITVEEAPSAGTATDITLCNTESAFDLFVQLADEDTGGDWVLETTGTGTGAVFVGATTDGIIDFTAATAGTYNYTYTVAATAICPADSETVQITIEEAPSAGTPTDATVCSTENAYDLFGQLADEDTGGSWTNTGAGTGTGDVLDGTTGIVDYTAATAGTYVYEYEIAATATCPGDISSVTITVEEAPTAFAGDDEAFCAITEIDLSTLTNSPSVTSGTILWTTSSTEGSFDDATLVTPTYIFGNDDISNGSVTLTLTVSGNGACDNATDELVISIGQEPTIAPIADTTICAGETIQFDALVENEGSIEWSTAGDGAFDDETILNSIYTPGENDSISGSVDISLTAFGLGTCSDSTFTFTLNINTIDVQLANLENTSGCGAADGAIALDITSNGAGPISVIWMGPNDFMSSNEDISNLEAGIYNVQVTDDATGCIVNASYEIVDPVPFTIDGLQVTNQTSCGVEDGTVSIEVNDGNGPFNYYIEDENGDEIDREDGVADSTYSFDALAPGDYQLFVEEGTCISNVSFTIQPFEEITATVTNSTPANCGNADGEISVDVMNPSGLDFDVLLFEDINEEAIDTLLNRNSTDQPFIFDSLARGTYTVVVRQATTCEFREEVVVNEAADFSIEDPTITNISDCDNPNGSINLTINNPNNADLTYTWVNNAGDTVNIGGEESFLNITEPGIFDVTITDGTCTISRTNIEITQPAECDYDCEDFRVTPLTEAATCLGVDDGKLFFLLRNVNASSPELNFDIKQAGADDATYNRFTVDNIGRGLIIEIDSSFATGTYTVVASDPNLDCVSDTFNINIGTKTTLTATIDIEQPTCTVSTGSISANVSGTTDVFDYILYFEGDSLTTNTSGVFADLEEGDYELEFDNQNNNACGLENQTFTIENTAVVDQSAVDIDTTNPECGEIFGTISASLNNLPSNYEFILVNGAGEELGRNTTGIFNEVPEGTYVIQFENIVEPGACPIADKGGIVIENNGSFTAVASDVEDIICNGASTGTAIITLEGRSTAFYSFDNGENWTQFTSGNRITGLPEVNNLLVSDADGGGECELSVAVGIEYLNAPFVLSNEPVLVTPASCTTTETQGQIRIPAVSGGVEPYTYFIDGLEVELDEERIISGLSRDANELIIEDSVGCTIVQPIRIIVSPNEIIFDVSELSPDNNCFEEPEGVELFIDPSTIQNVASPFVFIINQEGESTNTEFEINPIDVQDNTFEIGDGKTYQYDFEKGVRYNYTLISLNNEEACSRNITRFINGGAIIPEFEMSALDVASCANESGELILENIIVDPELPIFIEVFKDNESEPSALIDDFDNVPPSGMIVIDRENYGQRITSGEYRIRLYQQPGNGCSENIYSEFQTSFIDEPNGNLRAILVPEPVLPPNTERSRSEMNPVPSTRETRADGSITIRLEETTGAEAYFAEIRLLQRIGVNTQADYNLPEGPVEIPGNGVLTFDNLLPGVYEIEYYDSFGKCRNAINLIQNAEGGLEITVDYDRRPFIPNVFTPNNDNINDVFEILNLPDNGAELVVTNRNGTIVYRNSNYRSSNFWDGGDNPDGIYFYQLTVGGVTQKGWVEIIRGKR